MKCCGDCEDTERDDANNEPTKRAAVHVELELVGLHVRVRRAEVASNEVWLYPRGHLVGGKVGLRFDAEAEVREQEQERDEKWHAGENGIACADQRA